ncbi:MAG: hypothetical protein DRI61_06735 [Chloroflexi bacterium]|nr:MAG: hypothetical protein DRI61_06735 [Chloroflexota bacterium]
MAHVFTRPFKVRIYELDSLGHVNNAVYLRYCEQAAMEASESVGYTWERYRELGWIWVIRRTIMEHIAPAYYGDTINVTTWLSRVTYASAFREYLLTRDKDGSIIGRAQSRWALIDARTGRPVRMPREMKEVFQPTGKVAIRDLKPMRGEKPTENPCCYIHRRRVQRYELDSAGHVNNAIYLNWLEQAKFDAITEAGFPSSRLREMGITIVQTRIEIEYLHPALEGDEIEIHSWLAAMARTHGTWGHKIIRVRDGELLARAWSTGAFLDLEGHPTRAPEALIKASLRGPKS